MGSITPAPSPLNIAIIGAGIGGLALAIGLLRQNVRYTLYEAAAEYSAVGAGVGLGPNALRAMDMIDTRFKKLYDEISTGNLTQGKEHVMFDVLLHKEGWGEDEPWAPGRVEADCYDRTSAHRKALLDKMTSLIPINTVRFNKRVKSLQQVGNEKVVIEFEDGEVVEHSAVIGCDGAKGPTRGVVLGEKYPDQVKASYSGKYVYRSIVPMKDAIEILGDRAGDATWFMGPGANFTAFPISKGQEFNLVVFKVDKNKEWTHHQWTKEVTREEMVDDFQDGIDRRLVKLLDWAKPLQWSIHHHLTTPIYYKGLICLMGDSAHATTPHQASGAGQCLEDALILSHALGLVTDQSQVEAAFKIYDEIRRPRAQKVVQTSQEAGKTYMFQNPEVGDNMEKFMQNLNRRYLWIWEHDLEKDVRTVETEFAKLVGASA